MHLDERLERVPPFARDDLLPLFRLADDSEARIRSYYRSGDLFVLQRDGLVRGITLVVFETPTQAELKAVAVAADVQRRGVGRRMLTRVLAALRARGVRRVTVGTATSSVGAIAFYQKTGFRSWKVDRDYFNHARGYPEGLEEDGVPVRDRLWMDREL